MCFSSFKLSHCSWKTLREHQGNWPPTVVFRESFQFVLMSINIPEHIHKRLDVLLSSCVSLSLASKRNAFVLQKTQNIIVQLIFLVVYHSVFRQWRKGSLCLSALSLSAIARAPCISTLNALFKLVLDPATLNRTWFFWKMTHISVGCSSSTDTHSFLFVFVANW